MEYYWRHQEREANDIDLEETEVTQLEESDGSGDRNSLKDDVFRRKAEVMQHHVSRLDVPGMNDDVKVRKGFVQESTHYNPFASYRESDEKVVWELPEAEQKRYVIGKNRSPEEVKEILEDIMIKNLDTIKLKQGYSFTFPNSTRANMEYNEKVALSLLVAGEEKKYNVTRTFKNESQRYTSARTAWAIHKIIEAIDCGIKFSKRALFYSSVKLFLNQVNSDGIIRDICFLSQCRMSSLNIIPSERGMVLGKIRLVLKGGESLSCSLPLLIPNYLSEIEDVVASDPSKPIQYILVVEKESMLLYLDQMDFHIIHSCVILTGRGMPSISTREFLRFLKQRTGLPVFGMCDADPKGAEIMATYARGSVTSSYDNMNISVPSIRWVGLSTSDIDTFSNEYNLTLPSSSFQNYSALDLGAIDRLSTEYLELSETWEHRIKHMKEFKQKVEFEEFMRFGLEYLAQVLLPKLIKDAGLDDEEHQDTGSSGV